MRRMHGAAESLTRGKLANRLGEPVQSRQSRRVSMQISLIFLLLISLIPARLVFADMVTVTEGFASIGLSNFGSAHLGTLPTFRLDGQIQDAGGVLLCQVCSPGPNTLHVFIGLRSDFQGEAVVNGI